jgi:Rha family phage regulatory protein
MNQLIKIENGEVKLDSRMIAEHFDKAHSDVLKDIRDEIGKLESAELGAEGIFSLGHYTDKNGQARPCYEMTEEGALQLAARYDAVARRKLIIKIKELKEQSSINYSALSPELQAIRMMIDDMARQNIEIKQLSSTVTTIKDTIIMQPGNWREDLNRMFNKIVRTVGDGRFQELRHESYEILESRAHADLEIRLSNMRKRMLLHGASKSAIDKANKLDVIEADPKLREIYSSIIKEYTIKFVA